MNQDKESIRNVNLEHRERFTTLEWFAISISDRIGTMGFFLLVVLWTVLWFLWNVLAPEAYRFDPYPAFALWIFISNMMQLFFLPLIMMGQNLQGRHAELRAEAEFETGIKAEKEIGMILEQLEKQETLLTQIAEKVSKPQ